LKRCIAMLLTSPVVGPQPYFQAAADCPGVSLEGRDRWRMPITASARFKSSDTGRLYAHSRGNLCLCQSCAALRAKESRICSFRDGR